MIKKIALCLCLIMVIVGCSNKEKTVKNPNGKSETYQFFKENYNEDKYTLKLKSGNRDIVIIKDDDNSYYHVSDYNETTTIIEKDYTKYTLNDKNKTYSKENVSEHTNYVLGYLPSDLNKLKNKTYKTGEERRNFLNYVYEKYVYDGGISVYYFRNKKLKYITNKTPLSETEVEFISLSSKVDKNKFKLPSDYQELEF